MSRGWSQSLFSCAQREDERQQTQTEVQEVPSEYKGQYFIVRVSEPWDRLPRKVVDSPSLEIFKTYLDVIRLNVL